MQPGRRGVNPPPPGIFRYYPVQKERSSEALTNAKENRVPQSSESLVILLKLETLAVYIKDVFMSALISIG